MGIRLASWFILIGACLGLALAVVTGGSAGAGIWIALLLAGVGVRVAASRRPGVSAGRLRGLRRAAARAGLAQDGLQVDGPTFRGIRANCRVTVALGRVGPEPGVRIELSPRDAAPGHLTTTVEVGRSGFETGGHLLGAALISGRLLRLCRPGDRLHLERGQLRFETPADPDVSIDLGALADALAEGLHTLTHGDRSVLGRLLELVQSDPDPSVRRCALRALSTDRAHGPEGEQAILHALSDPDPELRLIAANLTDGGAQPVLLELLADLSVHPTVRAAALRGWTRHAGRAEVSLLAKGCLGYAQPELRAAAAEALGRIRDPSSAGALQARLATARGHELFAVAAALARVGDSAASDGLARALDRVGLGEAPAVLQALALLGDRRAAGVIRDFLRRADTPRELAFAAVGALRAIEARGLGQSAGALSLLESSPAGDLGFAELEAGALSEPQESAGRAATWRA